MTYIDQLKNIDLIKKKLLAHDIKMQKNTQTDENTSLILTDFHGVIRIQTPTCIAARNFHQWRH